jgi:cytochrome c oxidase subunit 2
MHPRGSMVAAAVCLSTLAIAATVGCSSPTTSGGGASTGGGMMGGSTGATAYASAGERIYLAGVGGDGQEIPRSATRVAQESLMMGGGGCASCHGVDGRGGTLKMMTGNSIEAPAITYDALVGRGFTDTTIGDAVRNGLDESGRPLDEAMPRWQMSDTDLAATIAYLKKLSAR